MTLRSIKLVAEVAQPLQPFIDIEKSRLAPHRFISRWQKRENQKSPQIARFLEAST
jgi:hypothetical protein